MYGRRWNDPAPACVARCPALGLCLAAVKSKAPVACEDAEPWMTAAWSYVRRSLRQGDRITCRWLNERLGGTVKTCNIEYMMRQAVKHGDLIAVSWLRAHDCRMRVYEFVGRPHDAS